MLREITNERGGQQGGGQRNDERRDNITAIKSFRFSHQCQTFIHSQQWRAFSELYSTIKFIYRKKKIEFFQQKKKKSSGADFFHLEEAESVIGVVTKKRGGVMRGRHIAFHDKFLVIQHD